MSEHGFTAFRCPEGEMFCLGDFAAIVDAQAACESSAGRALEWEPQGDYITRSDLDECMYFVLDREAMRHRPVLTWARIDAANKAARERHAEDCDCRNRVIGGLPCSCGLFQRATS